MIDGPSGALEIATAGQPAPPAGIALVAHPHPLHGGTMDNKVSQTLCRALHRLGFLVAALNFRGVGRSEGSYDFGIGEADDIAALARHARSVAGDGVPVTLAGFSFGAGVQARAAQAVGARRLLMVAPSVPEDVEMDAGVDTQALAAHNDAIVDPGRVAEWCRRNSATLTLVPDAGHFFHGRLHVVAEWAAERAGRPLPGTGTPGGTPDG